MSRNPIGTINPNITSGSQLAALLSNFWTSFLDNYSGTTRPDWAGLGTVYLNTNFSPPVWIMCGAAVDGSQDIPLFKMQKGNENQVPIFDDNGVPNPSSMTTLLSLLGTVQGPTSSPSANGVKGLVPAPTPSDIGKFLRVGNGSMGFATPDSARFPVVTLSDNTTLTTNSLTKVHKLTAAKTHTLPAGSGLSEGDYIDFEGAFAGRCTISPNGSDTIDGAASKTAYAFHVFRLEWNGSGWQTVGERTGTVRDINFQTGTSYTFAASDVGRPVDFNNAGTVTITVPANGTVAIPVGAQIDLSRSGAGEVVLQAEAGVTINSESSFLKLNAQHSTAMIVKTATNVWKLSGSLKA
jgi:hypothetical protein